MLLALNKLKELEAFFQKEKSAGIIRDFRVMLQLNMRIEVNLLVDSAEVLKRYSESPQFKEQLDLIRFREIVFEEGEKYDWLFPEDEKLREDFGPRRRLSNLIHLQERDLGINCPIVTVYSYKGGMGRSTTLAAFASWLAIHGGKKIVIVDCDFEAPGFTNYFDLDLGADNENQKSGIVEYLLDKQFSKLANVQLEIRKDYAYEVAQPYVGNGSVFIVPAGNLSNQIVNGNGKSHRDHYLESLARIDLTSFNEVVGQFKEFITEVYQQLELDENSVILFDSRTGFNDIFSTLASISDVIVGFFGINKQTKTGLYQFLDTFGNIEKKSIYLVNSLSSDSFENRVFKNIVETYLRDNAERFEDPQLGLPQFSKTFGIEYKQALRYIGTETMEDRYKETVNGNLYNTTFIDLIKNKEVFKELFEAIIDHLEFRSGEKKNDNGERSLINQEKSYTPPPVSQATELRDIFLPAGKNIDFFTQRESFLKKIFDDNNFPPVYADDTIPELSGFFFRDCMKGLFNRDAFLVVGYKGTGKTLIYQAFKRPEIVEHLCRRHGKKSSNFIFVNVSPIHKADDGSFFSATEKFAPREIGAENMNVFYTNFWLTYVWNVIYRSDGVKSMLPNLVPTITTWEITKLSGFSDWFKGVAFDTNTQAAIINDLKKVDEELKKANKQIILAFDQLDFVVKPEFWNIGVSPLINFWRSNPFNRIQPKIFLRADLFDSLSGITNSKSLQINTIDLAWKKIEIFEYWIKYIFQSDKLGFYRLILVLNEYSEFAISKIVEIDNGLDIENQINPDINEEHLQFLVDNFFGRYADLHKGDRYGTSFDWFFANLQDAKKAISLRPFLNLLKKAGEIALRPESLKKESQTVPFGKRAILPAWYYVLPEARVFAASEYFSDLADDAENGILRPFRDFIQTQSPLRLRNYEYNLNDMNELLTLFKKQPSHQNNSVVQERDIEGIKSLLIKNGIIEVTFASKKEYTKYAIPYLYRNFFNVGRPNQSM